MPRTKNGSIKTAEAPRKARTARNKSVVESKNGAAEPEIRCSFKKLVDPKTLVGHPRNPNKHGAEQVAMLAKIIEHQGWRNPIVVSNRSGYVVTGHGRLEAALKLGVKLAPVDYQDFTSQDDEYAHMLADNKIAELAEMDFEEVSGLLKEIKIDLSLTGFRDFELEPLLAAVWQPANPDGSSSTQIPDRHNIVVTKKQQDNILRAAKKKKTELKDDDMADGRAVELICIDYLAEGKSKRSRD